MPAGYAEQLTIKKERRCKHKKQNIGSVKFLLTALLKMKKIMSMKEAYKQKLQAQLDELSAEIEKLKAKADSAEADAQL